MYNIQTVYYRHYILSQKISSTLQQFLIVKKKMTSKTIKYSIRRLDIFSRRFRMLFYVLFGERFPIFPR